MTSPSSRPKRAKPGARSRQVLAGTATTAFVGLTGAIALADGANDAEAVDASAQQSAAPDDLAFAPPTATVTEQPTAVPSPTPTLGAEEPKLVLNFDDVVFPTPTLEPTATPTPTTAAPTPTNIAPTPAQPKAEKPKKKDKDTNDTGGEEETAAPTPAPDQGPGDGPTGEPTAEPQPTATTPPAPPTVEPTPEPTIPPTPTPMPPPPTPTPTSGPS